MKFRVTQLRRAKADVKQILSYLSKRSKPGAAAWANALDKAIARLELTADTFPKAAEDDLVNFDLREILFKTRRGLVYRALYTIRSNEVFILHVRGPGQDFLKPDEIDSPE